MKTLVFAAAGYNLAETGRMIEIAREARNHFDVIFASYGGKFEELIEEKGFPLRRMGWAEECRPIPEGALRVASKSWGEIT